MKVIRSPLTTGDGIRFGCGFALIQIVLVAAWATCLVVLGGSM